MHTNNTINSHFIVTKNNKIRSLIISNILYRHCKMNMFLFMIEWFTRGIYEYHLSHDQKDQSEARQTCLDLNGDLASIVNEEEQHFLTQHLDDKGWRR